MGYAIIGTRGNALTGTGSVSPSWGAGESRAVGNILICWLASWSPTLPPTPSGWSVGAQHSDGLSSCVTIYYKIAAGGDAAPSFVQGGVTLTASLAEFSGNATASAVDRTTSGHASSTGITITTAGTDLAVGELAIAIGIEGSSSWKGGTDTTSHAINNSSEHDQKNDSVSTSYQYNFTWGITDDNSDADQDVFTTASGVVVNAALATFKIGGVTYTDTAIMQIAISATLVESWNNRNYVDTPTLPISIAIAPNDRYPNYQDYPPITLNVLISEVESKEYIDAPVAVVAVKELIGEIQLGEHALLLRERPPLRLAIDIAAPDGSTYRWALDEPKPDNTPMSLSFSSTMPGGFEQLTTALPRRSDRDYNDLAEFSTITVRSPGGQIVWQGRLETAPRSSGDKLEIAPGAVGWQAALDDDKSAKMVYVDRQLSGWSGASNQRRIDYLGNYVDIVDSSVATDIDTGYPSLNVGFDAPWSRARVGESWYDGHSIPIGSIYAAWKKSANIAGSGWGWGIGLSTDDVGGDLSSFDFYGPTTSDGQATLVHSADNRTFACVHVECIDTAHNEEGATYTVYFTCLAVYGDHGLTKYGVEDARNAKGLLASDIVAHAVQTWAPALMVSTGPGGSVQPSSFVLPHSSFPESTTASAIIRDVTKYELQDWAVFAGPDGKPTFYWAPRNFFGRSWRATVGSSGLSEAGPQVDRLWNSVIVSYSDVTGKTRTVGPTGSGTDDIDNSLTDPDTLNPVTAAGLRRRTILSMGTTSTLGAAVVVGQAFLAEQKLLSTAGEAKLVGYVMNDTGVWFPASYIAAGDQISFTDAADAGYRRVVKSSWDDNSKTCSVSLDSPAEGLQALLERLNVVLVPIGF